MKETVFPGNMLREKREEKNCSLQEVGGRIHVPVSCLESFESGRVESMPGRAYAVGFLRSYCRFLDLPAEPFVDQYLLCARPQQSGGPFRFMRRTASDDLPRMRPAWVNDALSWATVCAVVVLGWLMYTAVARPLVNSMKARVEAGAEEIAPPIHFNEEF